VIQPTPGRAELGEAGRKESEKDVVEHLMKEAKHHAGKARRAAGQARSSAGKAEAAVGRVKDLEKELPSTAQQNKDVFLQEDEGDSFDTQLRALERTVERDTATQRAVPHTLSTAQLQSNHRADQTSNRAFEKALRGVEQSTRGDEKTQESLLASRSETLVDTTASDTVKNLQRTQKVVKRMERKMAHLKKERRAELRRLDGEMATTQAALDAGREHEAQLKEDIKFGH
jgi:hypothetical protein